MNRVFLSGNLTRDPEIKKVPASGAIVCNFGLASNEKWTDARTGEQRESVCFVEIEAWGRQAEVVDEYLKKGSPILVEGSLKFESWVAEDGTNRNRLKVRLQRFEFTGPPNGNPPTPADDVDAESNDVNAESVEPPVDTESATNSTMPATVPQANGSADDKVPF
jgi:single-strand DNA-binding protein